MRSFARSFEDTRRYLNAPPKWHGHLSTTNPIERVIAEFSKKTRKVGTFPGAQGPERTTYIVWRKLQCQGYGSVERQKPPPVLTPNF